MFWSRLKRTHENYTVGDFFYFRTLAPLVAALCPYLLSMWHCHQFMNLEVEELGQNL